MLQFYFLVTSDLESLKYVNKWLSEKHEWPTKKRQRKTVDLKKFDNWIGKKASLCGIIKPDDMCEKIYYYFKNPEEKNKDLLELQKYTKKNFSEKAIVEKLTQILKYI